MDESTPAEVTPPPPALEVPSPTAQEVETSKPVENAPRPSNPTPVTESTTTSIAGPSSAASKPASTSKPSSGPAKKNYSTDPALYIYTSLTAGSSHIVTATSRLETILRANRVPFKAIDLATDEKARMLWGRRAGKDAEGRVRKLPALVQMGLIIGDLVEIEDWNEYGEVKQHVTIFYDEFTQPPIGSKPPVPKFTRRKVKPTAAATATGAAKATSTTAAPAGTFTESAPAPPAAPPLPGTTGGVKEAESAVERAKTAAESQSAPAEKESATASKASSATVDTTTLPIRSIAEEAAAKAKQVRLQALRNKVHGAAGSAKKEEDEGTKDMAKESVETSTAAKGAETTEADKTEQEKVVAAAVVTAVGAAATATAIGAVAAAAAITKTEAHTPVYTEKPTPVEQHAATVALSGLQSPTTGTWRGGVSMTGAPDVVQSPSTTSWQSNTKEDAGTTIFMGARVVSASAEEIRKVEEEETIEEEDEEEDEKDRDVGDVGQQKEDSEHKEKKEE